MRPGPFVVEVNYHGNKDNYGVDIHSGANEATYTVKDAVGTN